MVCASLEKFATDEIIVRVETGEGNPRFLTYRASEPVFKPPRTLDFMLTAMCQFASARGQDLFIDGDVTTSQLANCDEFIQIWSNWRPDIYKPIRMACRNEVKPTGPVNDHAVIPFSNGVDSTFSFIAHREKLIGHLAKEIDFGFIVEGFDIALGNKTAIDVTLKNARETLSHYDIPCVAIATNWKNDFCPNWSFGFNAGVCSILQLFSPTHGYGIFSNDHSYKEELLVGSYGSHMVTNHLLGSQNFPIISTGGTHTRLERVREIGKHGFLADRLRVCYQDHAAGVNCGHCEKCIRTQLEMQACGIPTDAVFPSSYALDDLKRVRAGLISTPIFLEDILKHLNRDHSHYSEIEAVYFRELAKFKPQSRSIGNLALRRLTNPLRKIYRRMGR
ncbi:MAG: hypothetical protein BGN84_09010 [Afipia sp. 62-7]|nr:MAG: hypothetical protein BGN84_09010 [Afipia sp. 62-7]